MAFPYKILNDMSAKLKMVEAENARLRICYNQTRVNSVFRDEYYQISAPVVANRSEPADFALQSKIFERRNGHISAPGPEIKN